VIAPNTELAPIGSWLIDGNNVYGSRPDGWWNDRSKAAERLAQHVAEWCRTHDADVTVVFDGPVAESTSSLAGGNLRIVEAPRRGRNAADDHIVELAEALQEAPQTVTVVTSDRGLRARLPSTTQVVGVGEFRELIGY
jgi:predicted RNA-binding protein with PIN domain